MKIENLERANLIQNNLKHLKEQKEKYESSFSFDHSTRVNFRDKNNYQIGMMDLNFIDFEVMKTLALSKIDKMIQELEK